jgi:hypothetical protein
MKVGELREKLAKIPDDMYVVVYWEEGPEHQYFGIDDVSPTPGTPLRRDGKVGFTFESKGNATWLFLAVTPESK